MGAGHQKSGSHCFVEELWYLQSFLKHFANTFKTLFAT